MGVEKEDITQELEETLKEIYESGFEIRDILKEKYNYPSINPVSEILVNPNLFYFSLFESFWELFKIISSNIESPLVQPWIRVIIEQSSDIFWYSKEMDESKKEIACEYWLCALGFLGGKQGNLDYNDFLDILNNHKKKSKFLELKNNGYPKKEFHKIWHNLFPPINENRLPDIIEKYYLTLKGNSIKKLQLEMFFRDMSLYHHPNLIMNNLEKEFKDKSHMFRCFALLSICGMSLIRCSIEKKFCKIEKKKIKELNKKINSLFQEFGKKNYNSTENKS
jgi:hypothetical protein